MKTWTMTYQGEKTEVVAVNDIKKEWEKILSKTTNDTEIIKEIHIMLKKIRS